MNPIKNVFKNINVLNLLLLAVAVFLYFNLDNIFIDKGLNFTFFKQKEAETESVENTDVERTANYSDYSVITEKNLFHPSRKISSDTKQEQETARPEIILYGTLITDEKRIAYIEDKKSPYSTPGRGKRQVAINEGGTVAGYKLEKVNAESILLVRGEDKITVTLNTDKERKSGDTAAKTTTSTPSPASAYTPQTQQSQASPTRTYTPPLPPIPSKQKFNSR